MKRVIWPETLNTPGVIPVEAGTQYSPGKPRLLDPRIRGDDERVDMIRTKETLNQVSPNEPRGGTTRKIDR